MAEIRIAGGRRLSGEISVHGAKNSVLPVLAACVAANGRLEIHNCPQLSDVSASAEILGWLGCRTDLRDPVAYIDASSVSRFDIPESLMREMRSSITFLGAMLARGGRAEISMPGGCELGARPIDLHLSALARMGAIIEECHGYVRCRTAGKLRGCAIPLSFPSVGATENIMIAASTAEGTTVISNAAREPEITDLADFLTSCGAKISGAGGSTITVEGVGELHGCTHEVIPDRIEAATYMAAAAVTGGDVILKKVVPEQLVPIITVLEDMGCSVAQKPDSVRIVSDGHLRSAGCVRTLPYPGFPTDAQAIIMAAACVACGTSVFVENIFDSRFKHVGELCRLGARITTEGRTAVVEGVPRLTGAAVRATDLRGAAALVVAGLAAYGVTAVTGLHHLDRGYQGLDDGLRSLGADIVRI